MDDLTKEELLEWLRCLYVEGIETIQAKDDVDHEEAHDQLVKIVEGHFKYKYLDNDPECYHVADIQKRTVTREEIKRIYVDVRSLFPHQALDALTHELKELGIEVSDD